MIYEYRCKNKHEFERILSVADYNTPQVCECGAQARRIISIPRMVKVSQNICYDSPIDGRPITSLRQRQEDLARNHCSPYEPEIKQDYKKRIERGEKEIDKKIDDFVDRTFDSMSGDQLQKLDNEIRHSEINIERNTPPQTKREMI